MQRGRVARNVVTLVDAPTVVRPEIAPLTSEDVRALLATAAGMPNAARWSVALALWLRQGEALGLLWEDVDLDAGTLTVRRALQRVAGKGLTSVQPKSFAGRRTMALPAAHRIATPAPGLAAPAAHGRRQRLARRWLRVRPGQRQAVRGPNGSEAWKRLLKAAGVRDARLHDARHTAATLLPPAGRGAAGGHAAARALTDRHDDALHPRGSRAGTRGRSPDGRGALGRGAVAPQPLLATKLATEPMVDLVDIR